MSVQVARTAGFCFGVRRAVDLAEQEAQLQEKGCEVFDATCPFVARIHRIAEQESAAGRTVVIIGTEGHPEVEGIQGWCQGSRVYEGPESLWEGLKSDKLYNERVSLLAQTTVNREGWNKSAESIKKECTYS